MKDFFFKRKVEVRFACIAMESIACIHNFDQSDARFLRKAECSTLELCSCHQDSLVRTYALQPAVKQFDALPFHGTTVLFALYQNLYFASAKNSELRVNIYLIVAIMCFYNLIVLDNKVIKIHFFCIPAQNHKAAFFEFDRR